MCFLDIYKDYITPLTCNLYYVWIVISKNIVR